MLINRKEFAGKPIKHLMEISGRNAWLHVDSQTSLNQLMSILIKNHRVAVSDQSHRVVGFITQSTLVGYLYKQRSGNFLISILI